MKKIIFFAAVAVMAITACSKTEIVNNAQSNVIAFQPANYMTQTKVTGSVFPETETFGVYAWTAGTTGEYFIDNNEVSLINGAWTTTTPYFWPKNQTVDFFCYYPFDVQGAVPQVAANQIKYNDIDFSNTQVDIMYADKAVGYTDNADQVEDGQNTFEGVPVLFRHAAAKVSLNVVLGENEKTELATGTSTKWDVRLKQVVLSGIYVKGSCTLNLATDPTTGIVPWVKPTDTDGNYVWTADQTITNSTTSNLFTSVQVKDLEKGVGFLAIPAHYMLPQTLVADQQKVSLVVDITTYKKEATDTDYPTDPFLVQNDVTVSADLLIPSANGITGIYAWQMNQNIVYTITLGPAGKQITFDPAIEGWQNLAFGTNIELDVD